MIIVDVELDASLSTTYPYTTSLTLDVTLISTLQVDDVLMTILTPVTLDGTLSTTRTPISGTITADVTAGTVQTNPSNPRPVIITWSLGAGYYQWGWDYSPYPTYEFIYRSINFATYDYGFDPPIAEYEFTVPYEVTVPVTATVPLAIPTQPVGSPGNPAPPAPPEDPTNFPMPASGGIVIRAIHGVVVDMDTPTITDGEPSS